MAQVRIAGKLATVATTLVAPVETGDLVLVHAGTAIGRVDEDAGTAGIKE
jgi:hydrogenase maturation factor